MNSYLIGEMENYLDYSDLVTPLGLVLIYSLIFIFLIKFEESFLFIMPKYVKFFFVKKLLD